MKVIATLYGLNTDKGNLTVDHIEWPPDDDGLPMIRAIDLETGTVQMGGINGMALKHTNQVPISVQEAGRKGGKAWAESRTAAERSAAARHAARARWQKARIAKEQAQNG